MLGKKARNRIRKTVLAVGAVIVILNMEKLVEALGWDGLLVSVATYFPAWLQGIWTFLTSSVMLAISLIAIAYCVGYGSGAHDRYEEKRRKIPINWERYARECELAATMLEENADFFDIDERGANYLAGGIRSAVARIAETFRDLLRINVSLWPKDRTGALKIAQLFRTVIPLMRSGDVEALKKALENYSESESNQLAALPNAFQPQLSVRPGQPDRQ